MRKGYINNLYELSFNFIDMNYEVIINNKKILLLYII